MSIVSLKSSKTKRSDSSQVLCHWLRWDLNVHDALGKGRKLTPHLFECLLTASIFARVLCAIISIAASSRWQSEFSHWQVWSIKVGLLARRCHIALVVALLWRPLNSHVSLILRASTIVQVLGVFVCWCRVYIIMRLFRHLEEVWLIAGSRAFGRATYVALWGLKIAWAAAGGHGHLGVGGRGLAASSFSFVNTADSYLCVFAVHFVVLISEYECSSLRESD